MGKRKEPSKDEGDKEGPDTKKLKLAHFDEESHRSRLAVMNTSIPGVPELEGLLFQNLEIKIPSNQEESDTDMQAWRGLVRRISKISNEKSDYLGYSAKAKSKEAWRLCLIGDCAFKKSADRVDAKWGFVHHLGNAHGIRTQETLQDKAKKIHVMIMHGESGECAPEADISPLMRLIEKSTKQSSREEGKHFSCFLEECASHKSPRLFQTSQDLDKHVREDHSIAKRRFHEKAHLLTIFVYTDRGGKDEPATQGSDLRKTVDPPSKIEKPTFKCDSCDCVVQVLKTCEMHSLNLDTCGTCERQLRTQPQNHTKKNHQEKATQGSSSEDEEEMFLCLEGDCIIDPEDPLANRIDTEEEFKNHLRDSHDIRNENEVDRITNLSRIFIPTGSTTRSDQDPSKLSPSSGEQSKNSPEKSQTLGGSTSQDEPELQSPRKGFSWMERKQHIRSKPPSARSFSSTPDSQRQLETCKKCAKVCRDKLELRVHMSFIHKERNPGE